MKIFDFTDGTIGEQIGTAPLPSATSGWIVVHNDTRFKITLTKPPRMRGGEILWKQSVSYGRSMTRSLDPAEFGVSAIAFCMGEQTCGEDTSWQWVVVGTADWNREACRSGILSSEKLGPAFPPDPEDAQYA